MEFANRTGDYAWRRAPGFSGLITLCPDSVSEELPFKTVFLRTRRELARLAVEVCFLPSYAPKQSLAALLAARSLGVRTVMMNESHAGTARASGAAALAKRWLVGLFHAALVGGNPQKRYFASMGLPGDRIFTGYDAVDNDYFARRAEEVRGQRSEVRGRYGLPEHYFLSLGRFIAKKNLGTLIRAYGEFLNASSVRQTHLVMVGSGEEEQTLRSLCTGLQLPIYDHSTLDASRSTLRPDAPGVHFYGFRQIEENPVFYALADAFILPSLYEEWGLVVNEAMASGLPVVVSETAGCAEDLLEPGWPAVPDHSSSDTLRALGRIGGRMRKNGFVFDPQSPGTLAGTLLALGSVPALPHAMGQASRRIVEKFSCENFSRNALMAARAALGKGPVFQAEAAPGPVRTGAAAGKMPVLLGRTQSKEGPSPLLPPPHV